MIFEPEYAGACSCRIGPPPPVNSRYAPSGDQLTPPILDEPRATRVSAPVATDRTIRSASLAIATRVPSGDGTPLSVPPPGTTTSDWLSALHFGTPPARSLCSARRGCGLFPSTSTMYQSLTPARSQRNATWRPSGDHIGFDGCLMSMSCSMLRRGALVWGERAGRANAAADAAATTATMAFMMFLSGAKSIEV